MGIEIKRNKQGKLTLTSTVSGERLHGERAVDVDVAREILVKRRSYDSVVEMLKIFNDFPAGWRINEKYVQDKNSFMEEHLKNWNDEAWLAGKIRELEEKTGVLSHILEGTGYKLVKEQESEEPIKVYRKSDLTDFEPIKVYRKSDLTDFDQIVGYKIVK